MSLRWFELRPLLKAVVVTGMVVGGLELSIGGILLAPVQFSFADNPPCIILFLSMLLLFPILSALWGEAGVLT